MEAKCPKCQDGQMLEHQKFKLDAEKPNMALWVKINECSKCHYAELYTLSPRPW
jgi:predicted nucleic-acid-binding Zn-ribbon protein